MSDAERIAPAQTPGVTPVRYRGITEDGRELEAFVEPCGASSWKAYRRGWFGYCVGATPRAAALKAFGERDWEEPAQPVMEILAPGEQSRAEILAAAQANEREACALVAERYNGCLPHPDGGTTSIACLQALEAAQVIADAIRARGDRDREEPAQPVMEIFAAAGGTRKSVATHQLPPQVAAAKTLLTKLASAATPGPWFAKRGACVVVTADDDVIVAPGNGIASQATMEDCAFIAAVRNELPVLLDALEVIERLCERPRTAAEDSVAAEVQLGQFDGFTPGPWRFREGSLPDFGPTYVIESERMDVDVAVIARAHGRESVDAADAALIAAAPRLLAEVQRLREAYEPPTLVTERNCLGCQDPDGGHELGHSSECPFDRDLTWLRARVVTLTRVRDAASEFLDAAPVVEFADRDSPLGHAAARAAKARETLAALLKDGAA